jgi:hypothetical protein
VAQKFSSTGRPRRLLSDHFLPVASGSSKSGASRWRRAAGTGSGLRSRQAFRRVASAVSPAARKNCTATRAPAAATIARR